MQETEGNGSRMSYCTPKNGGTPTFGRCYGEELACKFGSGGKEQRSHQYGMG